MGGISQAYCDELVRPAPSLKRLRANWLAPHTSFKRPFRAYKNRSWLIFIGLHFAFSLFHDACGASQSAPAYLATAQGVQFDV